MNATVSSAPSSTSLRKIRNVVIVGALAVASTFALSAWAHGDFGGGRGMGGPMMGHMSERMLDRVNATPEQRAQLKSIREAAMADLKGQRDSHAGLRDEAKKLFTQPNVDANAVEALRQKMLSQHDAASKRISQALVDASRVLTPEQRQQLADEMGKRGAMMKRHHEERRAIEGPRS
jgi:Spy/CpxP family protein refolding chaperone